jgi:hypothetical protein
MTKKGKKDKQEELESTKVVIRKLMIEQQD